jgi:NADPH2:quinone reductase
VPSGWMRQSRTIAGFWLPHALRDSALTTKTVTELFGLATSGRLRPLVGRDYPLTQASIAHTGLRMRRSVGKLILDSSR